MFYVRFPEATVEVAAERRVLSSLLRLYLERIRPMLSEIVPGMAGFPIRMVDRLTD